ncbi:hypothetical protein BVRB_6g144390 [Beta vulgaris subsp. vulgaris]|nr:hypothetical protein BVRB_6g144390 [Beta vulgaris subsp. vulgaris]
MSNTPDRLTVLKTCCPSRRNPRLRLRLQGTVWRCQCRSAKDI